MSWTRPDPARSYSVIRGMDPRADWLLGPGMADYLPYGDQTLIPFILFLEDQGLLNELRKSTQILVTTIGKPEDGKAVALLAFKSFFDDLATLEDEKTRKLRDAAKQITLCLPVRDAVLSGWKPPDKPPTIEVARIRPPDAGWPDGTVIIGVIDDGIAFAHERFRIAETQTRVQCFWHQDGPYNAAGSTVPYGREICKEPGPGNPLGIDDLLGRCKIGGSVDEDRVYREAKLVDFSLPGHKAAAWRASHGTHVLDIAAHAESQTEALSRPIIAVQLPTATTQDTSGADLTDKVLDAILYILERARQLSHEDRTLPVVITFSYGIIAGPHDGTSPLERMIDLLVQKRAGDLAVILPAGNTHLWRCHAEVAFETTCGTKDLPWRVLPDDQTPSFVEIWLPHQDDQPPPTDRIRLSITPPKGHGSPSPELGEKHGQAVELVEGGNVICSVRYIFHPPPTSRGQFLIALQPTTRLRPDDTGAGVAPSGIWTIRLHNAQLRCQDIVNAWIQRDDTLYGYPRRGRQSYFDDPHYQRYDAQGQEVEEDSGPSVVKRDGSISAIATGAKVMVAGGFRRREHKAAKYSAGGPIAIAAGKAPDANHRKPDAMLPSDDSTVHAGILAAGTRSGSTVAFSGTSVAAPQLARQIAGWLGRKAPGDRLAVKAEAERAETDHASKNPDVPELPRERGGWGRIPTQPVVKLARYWK